MGQPQEKIEKKGSRLKEERKKGKGRENLGAVVPLCKPYILAGMCGR